MEDERGTALRLESTGPNAENGWMIYKFDRGDLTLALFDGLGGRPDDFTPPAVDRLRSLSAPLEAVKESRRAQGDRIRRVAQFARLRRSGPS